LKGFFLNQSVYYLSDFSEVSAIDPYTILTPYIIGFFGFPLTNLSIIDPGGNIFQETTGFSPIYSVILPTFYLAAQVFFVLAHNIILQYYDIPWDQFDQSLVPITRGKWDPSSFLYRLDGVPFVKEASIFDGMVLNYSVTQQRDTIVLTEPLDMVYSHLGGSNYYGYSYSESTGTNIWIEDIRTRMSTSFNGIFESGTHTCLWIFTNVSQGDIVPIVVDYEGDHLFEVSHDLVYDLPGVGPVEVWVLEDLTTPGGFAWYEKSTGILLKGTFYYAGGDYSYELDYIDSNVEFIYSPNEYRPTLTLESVTPTSGDQTTEFTFSVTYSDADNNPPAYTIVVINGVPHPMEKLDISDKNYKDGCIYQYITYLQPGIYNYYFECSDWQAVISTDIQVGLEVFETVIETELRESLIFTIYPELLFGTPTLFKTLDDGTKVFNPTERLTITYDLATGVALHLLLEHIADPDKPEDLNFTQLEIVLEDSNMLAPYEFQFHGQTLPIFVPADAAMKSFFTGFKITIEDYKQFVRWEIDQLNAEIQESPDECWTGPVSNRKSAMNNKLDELKELIASGAFNEAYDKLFHDIKPKLTGLKTNENEIPWGNGVFNNPWVTCPDLQEAFREKCNEILFLLTVLMNYKPDTGISL